MLHVVSFDMVRRGLEGKNLRLISTDGGAGLIAGVEGVWPHVPRQRCWAHKLRNVASKVRKRNEKACLDGAKLIYLAPNRTEAAKRFRAWRARWIELEPKAVACLEADMRSCLSSSIAGANAEDCEDHQSHRESLQGGPPTYQDHVHALRTAEA